MKRILVLLFVVLSAAAGWYWWGGALTPDGGLLPPLETAATAAIQPAPQITLVQRNMLTATNEIANLIRPVAAAEKTGAGQSQRMRDVLDELDRAATHVPREVFDTRAVVAAVGQDRTALFEWVRDRTAFVPYNGSLRGPVGVLMDRLGNSFDRALLLAALLERAGREARLAVGSLDDAGRAKVMAAIGSRPRPAGPALEPADDSLARLAEAVGVSDVHLRAQFAKVEESRRALMTEAQARMASQTAAIKAAIAAPPTAGAGSPALDEHWWVQVEEDGNWIDLDPTLSTAKPGDTITSPQTTMAPTDVEDDRRHTLTVRVMAEVWRNGQRSDEPLLEHTFAPSKYHGQRIAVVNIPVDWPADSELLKADNIADAARTALIDQVEWIPVLKIGRGVVVKMSIDDHGELHDNSSPDANTMRLGRNVARVTRQALQGAMDLFSQLPGGANDPPEPKPARLDMVAFTRQWVEFELKAPGADPVRSRREIFDVLTAAERAGGSRSPLTDQERFKRALALTGETELLPMFAEIPRAYTANLIATRLAAARPALLNLARAAGKPVPDSLKDQLSALEPLPGFLYSVADARFSWAATHGAAYLDQLNLIALRKEMRAPDNGSGLASRDTVDFIANGVAAWPAQGVDPFGVRVAQGVADTVVEGALMIQCSADRTDCERGDNTSEVFAASGPAAWTMIRAGSSSPIAAIPARAQALVQADLAQGYSILAPSAPMVVAGRPVATWWRVNPSTGETLGMSAEGGSVSAENVITMISAAMSLMNCVPLLRGEIAPRSYREFQAIACLASGALGGGVAVVTIISGTSLGAVGAAAGLLGMLMTADYPGIFGF